MGKGELALDFLIQFCREPTHHCQEGESPPAPLAQPHLWGLGLLPRLLAQDKPFAGTHACFIEGHLGSSRSFCPGLWLWLRLRLRPGPREPRELLEPLEELLPAEQVLVPWPRERRLGRL